MAATRPGPSLGGLAGMGGGERIGALLGLGDHAGDGSAGIGRAFVE